MKNRVSPIIVLLAAVLAGAGCSLLREIPPCTWSGTCNPAPVPSPSPSPEPSPSASPLPSPSPSTSPSPEPSPSPEAPSIPPPSPSPTSSPAPSSSPAGDCEVGSVSLGFRGSVDKFEGGGRGYRNTFDLGMFDPLGIKYRPEDRCGRPAPVDSILIAKWGPFIVKVSGAHINGWDPVEIQTSNAWIAHESTNSAPDDEWNGNTYLKPGPRTYCATLAHLDHFVCQSGEMTDRGQLVGFGSNQRSFRVGKKNGLPDKRI